MKGGWNNINWWTKLLPSERWPLPLLTSSSSLSWGAWIDGLKSLFHRPFLSLSLSLSLSLLSLSHDDWWWAKTPRLWNLNACEHYKPYQHCFCLLGLSSTKVASRFRYLPDDRMSETGGRKGLQLAFKCMKHLLTSGQLWWMDLCVRKDGEKSIHPDATFFFPLLGWMDGSHRP